MINGSSTQWASLVGVKLSWSIPHHQDELARRKRVFLQASVGARIKTVLHTTLLSANDVPLGFVLYIAGQVIGMAQEPNHCRQGPVASH